MDKEAMINHYKTQIAASEKRIKALKEQLRAEVEKTLPHWQRQLEKELKKEI